MEMTMAPNQQLKLPTKWHSSPHRPRHYRHHRHHQQYQQNCSFHVHPRNPQKGPAEQ